MAKSKKTADAAEPTPKKAAAPKAAAEKKTAPKKSASKPAAAATPADVPQIDTTFAAQSAAKMLLNRAIGGNATAAQGQGGKESAAFKNMKEGIAKPRSASSSHSHLLGPTVDAKKSAGHFLGQQKGHNQTAGGFNKTGVPRRTNG